MAKNPLRFHLFGVDYVQMFAEDGLAIVDQQGSFMFMNVDGNFIISIGKGCFFYQ